MEKHLEKLLEERTSELRAANDLLREEIEHLRQTETKYRSLFANMLNGSAYHKIVVDDDNNIVDYIFLEVNDSFERITGLKREDIIGQKVTTIIPEIRDVKPDLIKLYGNVAQKGEETLFELYFAPFQKWYSVSAYSPEKGYFVSIFEDISERKQLGKSLMEIEERERRSIGHDLHDGLGQLLTGLAFKIRKLGRDLEKSSFSQAEEAADMSVLINEAKEQVSYLSRGLAPVSMDEEGLTNALIALSMYTKRMFGIPCIFKCEKPVLIHNETNAIQLYRIAQEAVTNAAKHAKPGLIEISLFSDGDKIIILVKDDGIGISERIEKEGGMGLKIMRYRAGIINASLDINRDGSGTLVKCVYTGY